ncbi:MAG: Gldg family protein [Planctomycetes bacterium]|nr:Gldg family protein [Planctomycetota bacterium]
MEVASGNSKGMSAGRRWLVGTNVALMVTFAAGAVAVVQAIAYNATAARWDMTSSGVNSLSEGTVSLLQGLDTNVRLTSLYFETDLAEEDQQRYRQAAQDLLGLYESSNRATVSAEWINPFKDKEKLQKLTARLREKSAYKEAIAKYKEHIDEFKNRFGAQIRQLLQAEQDQITALGAAALGGVPPKLQGAAMQLQNVFAELSATLEGTGEQVTAMTFEDNPQFSAATNEISSAYRKVADLLKRVGKFSAEQAADPQCPPGHAEHFREAGSRYASLVADLEAEATKIQELEPLKLDDILRELSPTSNAILVETDSEARVVDFGSVWPPMDPNVGTRARFEQRAFKGEEKLTSAILRVTHKEQTAVVFVRYGGAPLFLGGFMPGQPPAAYATLKQQLEDANFVVEEWDLKSSDTHPKIEPPPTKTIYVVLKPTPTERNPMNPQMQEAPFGESHRRAILNALGDKARAVFVAGWAPGPFGPIPSTYEYADYLKTTWGITVDTSALLIAMTSNSPGKYEVTRRDFYNMDELEVSTSNPIVRGPSARELALPWCAPLTLASPAPEGVTLEPLVTQPKRDGIWGAKNLQKYEDQRKDRDYFTKEPEDLEGPFTLAVAAGKGEAKIVVVSARDFATDQVAFAREMALGPQGFTIRSRNPGNVTLLLNSLHWLNDNTQFMNIGKPIDMAVLQIDTPSKERMVQVLTIFVWPALALVCGGAVWWVRRQ